MDCSLPGSSVHGILQERILEWVAISFSREPSQPRDRTQVSHIADTLYRVSHQGSIYFGYQQLILTYWEFFMSSTQKLFTFPEMVSTCFFFKKFIYFFLIGG